MISEQFLSSCASPYLNYRRVCCFFDDIICSAPVPSLRLIARDAFDFCLFLLSLLFFDFPLRCIRVVFRMLFLAGCLRVYFQDLMSQLNMG